MLGPCQHDRDAHGPVGNITALNLDRHRRLILVGLAAAGITTAVLVGWRGGLIGPRESESGLIARDQPAPAIVATTLDGAPFDLASLRGQPVIVNFWGPSCVPCRDEFPLFGAKLAQHAGDGLAIVGVLMYDPPAPAVDFMAAYGATWPTVDDPSGVIRSAYRAVARPQSYFIDPGGVLRAIQVGELTDCEFERKYALIRGPTGSPGAAPDLSGCP